MFIEIGDPTSFQRYDDGVYKTGEGRFTRKKGLRLGQARDTLGRKQEIALSFHFLNALF